MARHHNAGHPDRAPGGAAVPPQRPTRSSRRKEPVRKIDCWPQIRSRLHSPILPPSDTPPGRRRRVAEADTGTSAPGDGIEDGEVEKGDHGPACEDKLPSRTVTARAPVRNVIVGHPYAKPDCPVSSHAGEWQPDGKHLPTVAFDSPCSASIAQCGRGKARRSSALPNRAYGARCRLVARLIELTATVHRSRIQPLSAECARHRVRAIRADRVHALAWLPVHGPSTCLATSAPEDGTGNRGAAWTRPNGRTPTVVPSR